MPEIAEVETVRNTLKKRILNKPIKSVNVRYTKMIESNLEEFKKVLVGRSFLDIKRRGKWLIFDLGDYYLLSHLRMEGKYFIKNHEEELNKHEHVIITFTDNTDYDSNDYGGSVGDNGHMARMKSAKDVTIEGVGTDAAMDGWGIHFMSETSTTAAGLGKNFEVRNLTFMNQPEDAIGMEGVQEGSVITAPVERCWIHNNEFYSPSITGPAESDKAEGDGSCDFKRGEYLTVSYNYFEGCHKTNLVGSSDTSLQYNLTYHHNIWKGCKARQPLGRQANMHFYNNQFIGTTDYAMNTRANAYIYSEYNLFFMTKNPMDVRSGAIKSYNDSFSSCIGAMTGKV